MRTQVESYANSVQTTLASSATSGATSITVASATGFPSNGVFRIIIGTELLLVTGGQGTTTWTVQRGVEGTTAAGHSSGDQVTHVLTAASLLAIATNPIGDINVKNQGVYLGAHFEQYNQSLYLVGSNEGVRFRLLHHAPLLTGVRDPSIFYDGALFYVAYTRANTPFHKISIVYSSDLFFWQSLVDIDFSGLSDAGGSLTLAWAPEFFVDDDGTVRLFVAAGSSSSVMQIYETHATNAALSAWSTPVKLTGTSLPTNMIDACVRKVGNTYYVFYKNDSNKYVEVMTSTSLTSGYTVQGSGHWMTNWPAVSGNGWEGFCIEQDNSNTWIAWMDNTDVSDNGLGYQYSVFTGNPGADWLVGSNWSAPANCIDPPSWTRRHGTVIRIRELNALRTMLGLRLMQGHERPMTSVQIISGSQAISNTTYDAVSWNYSGRDDGGWWNGTTKITVPTTGWYRFWALIYWATSNPNGIRSAEFAINGDSSTGFGGDQVHCQSDMTVVHNNLDGVAWLKAGDYVEVRLWQTSGGNISIDVHCSMTAEALP